MVVEIGLVHPPVGMNVYIINRLAKDVPLQETFKGVMPFLASDFIRIGSAALLPGDQPVAGPRRGGLSAHRQAGARNDHCQPPPSARYSATRLAASV